MNTTNVNELVSSAKETTSLIESSASKTADGAKIADETAKTLAAIIEQINNISNYVTDISKSSDEQAASIEKVVLDIQQISQVTDSNAEAAEKTSQIAQGLLASS